MRTTRRSTPAPARQPLRMAVVGLGHMGVVNANAVRKATDTDLVAVVDPRPETAAVAHTLGVRHARTVADLLSIGGDEIDAVFVSVPHDRLASVAVEATQASKHVFVEKPGAVDPAALADLVRSADASRVVVGANYWYRQVPALRLARRLVEGGATGDVYGVDVRVHVHKSASYWAGDQSDPAGDWRSRRDQAGGGMLIMTTCHAIDAVRYVARDELTAIRAELATNGGFGDVEDILAMTFRLDGGAIGSLSTSSSMRGVRLEEVTLWGSHGTMKVTRSSVDLFSVRRTELGRGGRWHRRRTPTMEPVDAVALAVDDFARAVATGQPPSAGLVDLTEVLRVITDAYRTGGAG